MKHSPQSVTHHACDEQIEKYHEVTPCCECVGHKCKSMKSDKKSVENWGELGEVYETSYALVNYDGKVRCAWCNLPQELIEQEEDINKHVERHDKSDKSLLTKQKKEIADRLPQKRSTYIEGLRIEAQGEDKGFNECLLQVKELLK